MKKFCVSLPYEVFPGRILELLIGLFLFGMGVTCGVVTFSDGGVISYLFLTPAGIGMLWAGIYFAVRGLMMVHFVPEGIALTLLGKTVRLYPREQIKLFARTGGMMSMKPARIGICCHSREELVALHEQKLRRKRSSQRSVDTKMNRPGWQDCFFKDEIRRLEHRGILNPYGRECLWLPYVAEHQVLLNRLYPEISWELNKCYGKTVYYGWKDPDGCTFFRGRVKKDDYAVLVVVCCIIMLFPVVLLAFPEEQYAALGFIPLYMALWLPLMIQSRAEYDRIWLNPEGIKITRGKTELAYIPAEKFRTVFRGEYPVKGGLTHYLVISELDCSGLTEKIKEKYKKSKCSLRIIEGLLTVPGGAELVIARFFRRRMLPVTGMPLGIQMIVHTADRERMLRERYPDACWVDMTMNAEMI